MKHPLIFIHLDIDIWHGSFEHKTGIAKISVRDGKVRSTKTYLIDSDASSEVIDHKSAQGEKVASRCTQFYF